MQEGRNHVCVWYVIVSCRYPCHGNKKKHSWKCVCGGDIDLPKPTWPSYMAWMECLSRVVKCLELLHQLLFSHTKMIPFELRINRSLCDTLRTNSVSFQHSFIKRLQTVYVQWWKVVSGPQKPMQLSWQIFWVSQDSCFSSQEHELIPWKLTLASLKSGQSWGCHNSPALFVTQSGQTSVRHSHPNA